MKKFKDPLPQGGVPFFADDFLMLQAELLKASMYMYSSLNTEVILSGCVPVLSGMHPSPVRILSISAGFAIIRDRLNAYKPEIYEVPATTFAGPVAVAYIIPDIDTEESRTLKSGTTTGIIVTKKAKIVTSDADLAANAPYPKVIFDPIPSTTLNNLLFRNSKKIGEVVPIALTPPFRSNPMYGPNGIPFFQETTVSGIQQGFGRYDYEGFAICNGLNNTPDLRRRSMVGFDPRDSKYALGGIGGAEEVYLSKEYLPPHTHSGTTEADGLHKHTLNSAGDIHLDAVGTFRVLQSNPDFGKVDIDMTKTGEHTHVFTTDGGSGLNNRPHDNRSPYYSTLYIQRIA